MIYQTGTVNILRHVVPGLGAAAPVADFTGDGAFTPEVDTTVMLRDEKGGAGMVDYDELRQVVEQKGGAASGREVAAALSGQAEGKYMQFGDLPPGLTHPIVEYVFRLDGDQLKADYKAIQTARVISPEDGNIAIIDLNGDGRALPEHDAMVSPEAWTSQGDYTVGMVGLATLKELVRQNGGRIGPDEHAAWNPLGAQFPGKLHSVTLVDNPQHISMYDNVQRTWRLEGDDLLVDFHQSHR